MTDQVTDSIKVSDYIIEFIGQQRVRHVFEFIGGAITHLIDSIYHHPDVECVSVHHEQTAAFAAEAYARMNGSLGVAMATSGPGALNMVTGIGSCWFDSVPCLFITGQVNTYEYKFDRPVRQVGFQETDIVSVVKGLTKYAVLVTEPESIRYHLEKAVYMAQNGRPGPVLLDIPMNVQRARIVPETLPSFQGSVEQPTTVYTETERLRVGDAYAKLQDAHRPVILVGGGVRTAGGVEEFQSFVKKTGIPVVSTLLGLDAVPHDWPEFCGMIGSYGNRYSNLTLANADFLLIIGARLDSRQTGTRPDTFARAAFKVHVDIDPNELNEKVQVDIAIESDALAFLKSLNQTLCNKPYLEVQTWKNLIQNYRECYPTCSDLSEFPGIDPNLIMGTLANCCSENDVICLDVGQNQMWAGQSFAMKAGQRMLISGGLGAMGFALPAALGAAKTKPGQRVLAVAGDGGIQVNIQDLDTIVAQNLPVKIIVFNNQCLGMVRQFQDIYFDGRQQSTVIGYHCPDLVKIAQAYGLPTFIINSLNDAEAVICQALEIDGPAFVEVKLVQNSCVNPKLMVNRPIEDMSPQLDPEELLRVMIVKPLDD